MAWETESKSPWYMRLTVHLILAGGAVFFLLPLVWMMATSFKPLSDTMTPPQSFSDVFLGKGYRATIEGKKYDVVPERDVVPTKDHAFYIVSPTSTFLAGELWLSNGPEEWKRYSTFNEQELSVMMVTVTSTDRVLADENNTYDPATKTLKLESGRRVPATLIRQIEPSADGSRLQLVRQWLPEDTDAKEGAPPSREVTRPWDVLPASDIQHTIREIPQNYPVALSRVGFLKALLNTLFLCCMCVGGAVVSSTLVAYGFAFVEFRGRNVLFGLTVATMMIPFVITMIPVYLLYRDLHWVGTFKPLWVTAWFGGAFFIFLLRQFFLGLPKDLLDAARIDGCTELEILWHVIVPLSRPAIAMVALFTFLGTWKDFMGPLIYLMHPEQYTLSLSLQVFYAEHGGTPWHLLMAASTLFSLPLVILFFLTMKTFIRGIAMTGIKG